jgi:hypothetical protein
MRITVEAVVAAPPEIVFAVAADVGGWPQVISAIEGIELLTPGPVAAGTRFRETRRMFGRQATEEMTVAEHEPPRRFVLTAFNHGTAYRAEHLFAPDGTGTRIELAFEGRPVTLAARLLAPLGLLFVASLRRQLEGDLADLAREAERRHRQGRAHPSTPTN